MHVADTDLVADNDGDVDRSEPASRLYAHSRRPFRARMPAPSCPPFPKPAWQLRMFSRIVRLRPGDRRHPSVSCGREWALVQNNVEQACQRERERERERDLELSITGGSRGAP